MDTSEPESEFPRVGSLSPRKSVWALVHYKPRVTPFWVKYYPIGAYITFGVNLVVVFVYLIYLGLILNQGKMYMRYKFVTEFHEMNSYSLLSPFMAFPIVAVMSYHVKHKKNLIDGDFLGILGVVLLMAGISIYDATKLFYINNDLNNIILNNTGLKMNETERFYQVFHKSTRHNWIQNWTHLLQMEHKCCGAYGWKDWSTGKLNRTMPWSCCCNAEKTCKCAESNIHKRGCAKPLWEFLISINKGTSICMLVLAFAYVLTMIAYIIHWAAMQKEDNIYTVNPEDHHPFSLSNYDPNDTVHDKRISRINRIRHHSVGAGTGSKETLELLIISPPKIRAGSAEDKMPKLAVNNLPAQNQKQPGQSPVAVKPLPAAPGPAQQQQLPQVGSNQAQKHLQQPPGVGSAQLQPPENNTDGIPAQAAKSWFW